MTIAPELERWKSEGSFVETTLFRHKVFCKQVGSPEAAPAKTLLLFHGFPESSFSYHKVLPGLSRRFDRIVLFDFVGYGWSDKPANTFGYSLFEQADVALRVWRHLGVTGGHLLAHDMGDSVATELVARHVSATLPGWFSAGFQSFTFTNGSMVLALADLRVTQRLLLSSLGPIVSRAVNYKLFSKQIRSAHGAGDLGERDVELLWEAIRIHDGHTKNHLLVRYLTDRKRFEETRWLPSLGLTRAPVHLCWGDADAVARVEMAHHLKCEICPSAKLTVMPGVGHFGQLGAPEAWETSVSAFYEQL